MSGELVTLGETMGLLAATEPGPLHHVATMRLRIAGAESNVAIGARRLGTEVTWIGRVGSDEVGDLVARELRAEGVNALIRREKAPTGLMLKTARTGEITRVTYYRNGSAGSRLNVEDIDELTVARASVLHVTGITPALGPGPAAAVRKAIEVAQAHGVIVSVDLNYRAALWDAASAGPVLRDLVKAANVLFAGEHEAALVVPATDPEQMARDLSAMGPDQVVVKLGDRGCVALIDGNPHTCGAMPVRSLDPVGAGDAFVAGYLSELVAGAPDVTRLVTATAAGAFAVTVPGDWEGLPTRSELTLLNSTDNVVR